jgi:uncharacterized protein (UPF0147 family)
MGSKAIEIIRDDVWHQTLLHSRDANDIPASKAGEIAKLLDSGLQQRDYTMGGGYQRDTTSQVVALTEHPHFVSQAERHKSSNLMGSEMSSEMLMQLDLIQAAGSMTKDLKETILEISESVDTLTAAQRNQFVAVVFNTYQLHQANAGRITLPVGQIENLARDTLDIMKDLANDVILPVSLKQSAVNVIKTTEQQFQIPGLSNQINQFEKMTSSSNVLEQSVGALKATLMDILNDESLSEEKRQSIEDTLKQLDDVDDGEPIPRDVLKSLSSIAESLLDGNSSPELKNLQKTLEKNIEKTKEANLFVKAEKFNLTVGQVRSIEATMDQLDTLGEALPNSESTLKEMIAEAVLAMDSEPISIKAAAKLEAVTDYLQDPKFESIKQNYEGVTDLAALSESSSRFTQKIIMDGLSKQLDIPKSEVQSIVDLYKTLDSKNNLDNAQSIGFKGLVSEALSSINKNPLSIAALSTIDRLARVPGDGGFIASIKSNAVSVSKIVTSAIEKNHGIPRLSIQSFVNTYGAIQKSVAKISSSDRPLRNMARQTLDAISTSPVSIATAGMIKTFGQSLSPNLQGPRLQSAIQSIQETQATLLAKVHNIAPQVVKSAIDLTSSLATTRDAIAPMMDNIKASPIVNAINETIQNISQSPASVQTILKGTEALYDKGLEKLSKTNETVQKTIDTAKTNLDNFKSNVIEIMAEKSGQPIKAVKENINSILDSVKQAAGLAPNPAPQFRPESYVETKTPQNLDIHKMDTEKPSLFEKPNKPNCPICPARDFCGLGKSVRRTVNKTFGAVSSGGLFKKDTSRKLGQRPGPK